MAFNRVVVPSEGGVPGKRFAEFLNIDEDSELTLTEMTSRIYDRLYRLGMMRHVDGSRAHRRRARARRTARSQTRRGATATKAKAKKSTRTKAKTKAKPKTKKTTGRSRSRSRSRSRVGAR